MNRHKYCKTTEEIYELIFGHYSPKLYLEMKFLDITLTKVSSLLLHAIQSLLLAYRKPHSTLVCKTLKPMQKIRETRKLESIHEKHFVEQKSEGRKPDKTRVYAQKPGLKMLFKNSI